MRPGNVHSSTQAGPFLEQTFELLGEHTVRYTRFDKGFGGEAFYALLERQKIGYVGKMKWTKRLAAEVAECRVWKRYVDEDWIIEGIALWYQATSWQKPRRVAVIRKAHFIQDDQACLLLDTYWQYEANVTSMDWESIDLWRFYNQRCCMENYIKEAKRGFSIDKIATGSFEANEMDLLIKLLANNLYERFKHDCCEPVHSGYTLARFRLEFFQCAAMLVSHSRRVRLKLSKEFPNRTIWKRIEFCVVQLE
nr:transposase [Paenibacillus sonchi]